MIKFSELSNRHLIGRTLRLFLKLLPKTAVFPILQGPGRGLKWIIGSGVHGMWLGSYEAEKQQFIAQLALKGTTVLDIGAHTGFFSILLSQLVGSDGRVISFEPLPRNLEFLYQHIHLNQPKNITVYAVAVGREDGKTKFNTSNDSFQGSVCDKGDLEVEVRSLDSLEPFQSRVSIVKIDVEGAEAEVLKGGLSFFQVHRPLILLATHGTKEVNDCQKILADYNYLLTPLSQGLSEKECDEWIATPREIAASE